MLTFIKRKCQGACEPDKGQLKFLSFVAFRPMYSKAGDIV
jgi:hypothetical protein